MSNATNHQTRDPATFTRSAFRFRPIAQWQVWGVTIFAAAVVIGGLAYLLT
jgi:hypothetical protein